MKLIVTVLVLVAALMPSYARADWDDALDALLDAPLGADVEELLDEVVDRAPGWEEVAARIGETGFPWAEETGVPILRSTVCIDAVERPWVLLVPESYDAREPTPLLVVLHGGVNQAEIEDDPVADVLENELGDLALAQGWIAIFPFGQEGATWWDDVGMANIRNLIRTTKREMNIDDDRVWMAGFSDGASAGFVHAMVAPNDFAAFVALNGHMGVGSLDGDLPVYAPNMANTPIYATTTFDDRLYASDRMRPTIEMARAAGANILYREMPGEHDFDDVEAELPGVARFLERHARDPLPTSIVWETAGKKFGSCRWFAIDEVTRDRLEKWHVDHNVALVNDLMTVGFQPDYDFEGDGVLVMNISEGDYPASRMGLLAQDVIVRADRMRIGDLDSLNEWKGTVARGDAFELTVVREGERVVLPGRFPDPENYFIFKREQPSALAYAFYSANAIDVKTSRVGAFRILVHPDMIRLDQNLVVRVHGKVVHDAPVEPNLEYMLRGFLENRDRKLLYVAEVAIDLD